MEHNSVLVRDGIKESVSTAGASKRGWILQVPGNGGQTIQGCIPIEGKMLHPCRNVEWMSGERGEPDDLIFSCSRFIFFSRPCFTRAPEQAIKKMLDPSLPG